MKILVSLLVTLILTLTLIVNPVLAHVAVKPAEVGVASFQNFTVGVPNEKDIPTTSIRLILPEGLEHVTPNVKPGWNIEIKTEDNQQASDHQHSSNGRVIEIVWSGGSIPAGQRDEFIFSARTPANSTSLTWKAYQTYADGTIVAWDQQPGKEAKTPFSQTEVINNLTAPTNSSSTSLAVNFSAISLLALIISVASLLLHLKKK